MQNRVCKKCGNILGYGDNFCNKCGEKISLEEKADRYSNTSDIGKAKFCRNCGHRVYKDNLTCPNCGIIIETEYINDGNYNNTRNTNVLYDERNNIIAGLLAIFLGTFGIHKFYLGNITMGIIYLIITLFGFILFFIPNIILGLVVLVEGILYFVTDNATFNEKYNKNYKKII